MPFDRRTFLQTGAAAALASCVRVPAAAPPDAAKADHVIRIGQGLVELAPDQIISTTLYNGQFPGPLLRLQEGRRVVVDIHNDTDSPEQLHWHGQRLPVDVDGAAEEGTPYIPPQGSRRIAFTAGPAGHRFYHSHRTASADLAVGVYGGQAGPV